MTRHEIEALDKSKYLSKAFFNEKACSLTIRKADKVLIYRTNTMNDLGCLIGVININENFYFYFGKNKEFSVFEMTLESN